ncbi:bacillithiol biosynthesis cysteine-adding enzyme BshC [Hyphobacterium sp. CCMP332]|nr:bacillithiol biosynthesis cysteine-adding enzyme BshC [Hyphobacterium sp. CCMP332]
MLKLLESISYRDTNQFPALFLDYVDKKEELNYFYKYYPDLKGFQQLIEERSSFDSGKREILKNHFFNQYDGIEIHENVKENIEKLSSPDTFTLTTGHQLNLFTGPLYFIYKILTVINLAETLKKEFPDKTFVPLYWMASEDHDFEEIQYFNFDGKKYRWESDQKGAVGRFSLDKIQDFLKTLPVPEVYKSFYSGSSSLAEAHLKLVNHLFAEYGLVVLDADSKELKASFGDIIKNDTDSKSSFVNTDRSTKALKKLDYTTPVNPRKINYFYLADGLRERIEINGDEFYYDSNTEVQKIIIGDLIKNEPEKISPNVISRPLYQEYILPNLAYVGGPSELSYWLQLKSTFESLNINFPLLVPRYSASLVSEKALKKLKEIGLDHLKTLFEEERVVLKKLLIKNDLLDGDKHENWTKEIEKLFHTIKEEAEKKDKTLGPSVEGRKMKVLKELKKIRTKMESAEIRNQEILRNRFYFAKDELFPGGSFQERFDNVFEYLAENESFISELKQNFRNPFNFTHTIFKA